MQASSADSKPKPLPFKPTSSIQACSTDIHDFSRNRSQSSLINLQTNHEAIEEPFSPSRDRSATTLPRSSSMLDAEALLSSDIPGSSRRQMMRQAPLFRLLDFDFSGDLSSSDWSLPPKFEYPSIQMRLSQITYISNSSSCSNVFAAHVA
jgi:hypothetical protein